MNNLQVEKTLIEHAKQTGFTQFEDYMELQGIEQIPTFKLQAPGIYFLYGSTMSGKTTALKLLIQHLPEILEFHVPSSKDASQWLPMQVDKIDYFYGGKTWQKDPFDTLESIGVQFHSNGLPTRGYLDQLQQENHP